MSNSINWKVLLRKCQHHILILGLFFLSQSFQASAVNVKIPDTLGFSNGQNVLIPIITESITGLNVYSYYVKVKFDPSILSSTGVSKTGTLSASWSNPTINNSVAGEITIAAYGTNALSGAGKLLNLKFLVVGTLGSGATLQFESFMYNEGSPQSTTTNGSLIIGNSAVMNFNYTKINASCSNSNDGSIDVSMTGGVSPLHYIWSNGSTTQDISNLSVGTYLVTVSDNYSSPITAAVVISANSPLPSVAGTIAGITTLYQGQGNVIYSVPIIPNAASYIWQLPTGFIGTSSSNVITVTVANNALSGNISVKGHNGCGDGNPAFLNVSVFKQITIKLFLQGLFNTATNLMNQSQDQFGNHFGSGIVDKFDLELHNSVSPFSTIYSIQALDLLADGNCTFSLPSGFQDSYYIVIKHRNHLETWSSIPVSFSGISANYDFTNSNSKAFGSNQKLLAPGKYGLFAGDVNHDGSINQSDIIQIGSNSSGFISSYVETDVNGDGIVDALDLILTDNNAANFVMLLKP